MGGRTVRAKAVREASAGGAPFATFATFKDALRLFKAHGVPALVDASALRKRFPAHIGASVLATLRFLDLISADCEPTPALTKLVTAVDAPQWSETLLSVITHPFGPVLLQGLETATPALVNERLRLALGLERGACRKGAAFVLAAAQEAHLPVSPYLVAPSGSNGRLLAPGGHDKSRARPAPIAKLIDKFPDFDPSWPDALKQNWFTQFGDLIEIAKAKSRE